MRRVTLDEMSVPDISLPDQKTERFAVAAIALIYAVSFVLPAFEGMPGYAAFVMGAVYSIMIVGLPFSYSWLANPLLWMGLRYLWRRDFEAARVCGILAALLAAAVLIIASPKAVQLGYWTWLASMVGLVLATLDRPRGPALTEPDIALADDPIPPTSIRSAPPIG